jgi:hypothetical protein
MTTLSFVYRYFITVVYRPICMVSVLLLLQVHLKS